VNKTNEKELYEYNSRNNFLISDYKFTIEPKVLDILNELFNLVIQGITEVLLILAYQYCDNMIPSIQV
jgi:hypothetical protein